jgi:hypothetical protein
VSPLPHGRGRALEVVVAKAPLVVQMSRCPGRLLQGEREGSWGGVTVVAASGRASAAGERPRAAGGRQMDQGAGGRRHWVEGRGGY